jgi:tetratricopeptide (TPR) repeat protein
LPFLLPEDPEEAEEAAKVALDSQLLFCLINLREDSTFGSSVLNIVAAVEMGHFPGVGQRIMAAGRNAIDSLISAIEANPKLESHWGEGGFLGGCMARKTLLFYSSSLHMAMGNHSKATKDLTRALKIDPKYVKAQDARVNLWASLKLRDHVNIASEFKELIEQVHPDHRGLEIAYAWLGHLTLLNPNIILGQFRRPSNTLKIV